MKRLSSLFLLSFLSIWMLASCEKEYSVEAGGGASSSVGSLNKDAFGGCLPINVAGVYKADSTLGIGNFVEVQVQVTTAGTYVISSDTVNGYYFRATGVFNLPGANTVRLLGTGKPIAVGTDAFVVSYGNSECFFEVNVVASNTGGGGGTNPTDSLQTSIGGTLTRFNEAPSATLTTLLGFQSLTIDGESLAGQTIVMNITKTNTSPITAGTYTVNQFATGNVVLCMFTDTNSTIYISQTNPLVPQIPAFTITITSITATRVAGTFSGPVRDNSGAGPGTRTFTSGTFNVPIQ